MAVSPRASGRSAPGVTTEGAGSVSTVINIVKNVMGAGLLSLPQTLYLGTPVVAFTCMIVVGLLNAVTFWVLGVISDGACNSYGQLWERLLGRRTKNIANIALLINGIITCMQYLVLVSDYVPTALPSIFSKDGLLKTTAAKKGSFEGGATERLYPVLICAFLVIFPVALLSKLDFLKYPSFLGVFLTIYAVVYLGVDYFRRGYFGAQLRDHSSAWEDQQQNGTGGGEVRATDVLSILALYSSSYACHYNSPKFYRELSGASPKKYLVITVVSFAIILAFFVFFSAVAYGRFGGLLEGNVLKAYQWVPNDFKEDAAVKVAWLGMAFSVMTSYPLVSNSARAALFEVFFPYEADAAPKSVYVLVTFCFVAVSAFMGWYSPDIALLGKVKGATTTVMLCAIFPAILLAGKLRKDQQELAGGDQLPESDDEAWMDEEVGLVSERMERGSAASPGGRSGDDVSSERPEYIDVDPVSGTFDLTGAETAAKVAPESDGFVSASPSHRSSASARRSYLRPVAGAFNMVRTNGCAFRGIMWCVLVLATALSLVGVVMLALQDVGAVVKPREAAREQKLYVKAEDPSFDLGAEANKPFLDFLVERIQKSKDQPQYQKLWESWCRKETESQRNHYNLLKDHVVELDDLCK